MMTMTDARCVSVAGRNPGLGRIDMRRTLNSDPPFSGLRSSWSRVQAPLTSVLAALESELVGADAAAAIRAATTARLEREVLVAALTC